MRCVGIRQDGELCRAEAQRGYKSCPAHREQVEGELPEAFIRCAGLSVSSGQRCRAGARRGQSMCPQHHGQPLGIGFRPFPEKTNSQKTTIAIHRTTGIVKSLMPMITAKEKPYLFMIVGTTQISAFGRSRMMVTDDLLNQRVTVLWEQPDPQEGSVSPPSHDFVNGQSSFYVGDVEVVGKWLVAGATVRLSA